ncbi:MAG: VanZ family protein [Gammaproteobacteria bacterium]
MTDELPATELRFKTGWLLAAKISLVLTFVVGIVPVPVQVPVNNLDKLVHIALYFLPATIFAGVFGGQVFSRVIVGLLVFSSGIEMIQYWLPWRSGEWLDIAANLLGIALGIFAARRSRQIMQWVETVSDRAV